MIHRNKMKPIFSGVRTIKQLVATKNVGQIRSIRKRVFFSFCRQKYEFCLVSIKLNFRKPLSFFPGKLYLSSGFRVMYDVDGYRNTEPSSRVRRVFVQLNTANRTIRVFHG